MKIEISKMEKNSILDIYNIKDQIDPRPEYQRESGLWNQHKKQLFIDSIITGYDIPKLYLHVLSKMRKPTKQYAIIDGQQRLETIWGFIDNKFPLGVLKHPEKKIDLTGLRYRDLILIYPKLAGIFEQYSLPIMLVSIPNNVNGIIEDMFLRLNQSVPVSAAEKRNAMGGNVILMIKTLIKEPFFTKSVIIKNKRYLYHDICIKLLFIEYGLHNKGIFSMTKSHLDSFVEQFKTDELPTNVSDNVKNILSQMHECFHTHDNLLNSQAKIPIYYLLFREATNQSILIKRKKINQFVNAVKQNKKISKDDPKKENSFLSDYDRLTIQGTIGSSSIKTRFQIIAKYFGINSSRIHYPQRQLTNSF